MILTVTLNPALDKIQVKKRFFFSAGGKGINVSRTLKILGQKSLVTGLLGGKTGEEIKTRLRGERMSFDFEKIEGTSRVNLTFIGAAGRTVSRILENGPDVSVREWKNFKARFRNLLKKCDGVVLSGRPA